MKKMCCLGEHVLEREAKGAQKAGGGAFAARVGDVEGGRQPPGAPAHQVPQHGAREAAPYRAQPAVGQTVQEANFDVGRAVHRVPQRGGAVQPVVQGACVETLEPLQNQGGARLLLQSVAHAERVPRSRLSPVINAATTACELILYIFLFILE